LKRRVVIVGAIVLALAVMVGAYASFVYTNPAIVVRLVTHNPPVAGGLILPQNEKRNWDPDVVEVKVDTPVILAIVNNDDIEYHQFAIPELGVETKPIPPFESTTLEFTPTKVGNFTFIDPRPIETYTYTDYRGVEVHQVVDHSVETGVLVVKP